MNLAVITTYAQDELENYFSDDYSTSRQALFTHVRNQRRRFFEDNGYTIKSFYAYPNVESIDYILCHNLKPRFWLKAFLHGYSDKLIYVATETEVSIPFNRPGNFPFILKGFRYIMTWLDDCVDDQRVFKMTYGYWFNQTENNLRWSEKKLLVNVSSCITNTHPKALYHERYHVIRYFEDRKSSDFELYGDSQWEKEHLNCYKGSCINKEDVYQRFKFALCIENTKDTNGVVTEKILDCFCANVVPVYYGPPNIGKYIPKECYIDYTEFDTVDDLVNFLENVTKEEHAAYLLAARRFIQSEDADIFRPEFYSKQAIRIIERDLQQPVRIKWMDQIRFFAGISLLSLKSKLGNFFARIR